MIQDYKKEKVIALVGLLFMIPISALTLREGGWAVFAFVLYILPVTVCMVSVLFFKKNTETTSVAIKLIKTLVSLFVILATVFGILFLGFSLWSAFV